MSRGSNFLIIFSSKGLGHETVVIMHARRVLRGSHVVGVDW